MTHKEFFDLVKDMRKAQKNKGQARAYGSVAYCKALEDKVDAEIKRVEFVLREQAMPRLFDK